MGLNRYRIYMLGHGLIVLLVMGLFKWVVEKQVAALMAGLLFIIGPSAVLISEKRHLNHYRRASWWGGLIFLCFSALPIFLLRVLYWGEPFESLSVLGMTGPQLHQVSNYVFVVMLMGFLVDSFMHKKSQV